MIQYLKPNGKYLWKFFDLYKFISFLKTKEIVFSRLDQFEDSMEGCSEKLAIWIVHHLQIAEIPLYQRNPNITSDMYEEHGIEFLKGLNLLKEKQRRIYASCFYSADEESIAMWKLYSGVSGVAIRFDSSALYTELRQSFMKDLTTKMVLGGNEMNYIELLKISHYQDDGSIRELDSVFSPYNKDVRYKHENEYRFILFSDTQIADTVKSIKIQLDEKYFDFIISPDIENWKKELINQMIKENDIGKTLVNSDILSKEIVNKHKLKYLDEILGNGYSSQRSFMKLYR